MANEPSDNDFIQYWSAYGCWVTRTTPLVDHIDEATSAHGVTIDGVTLKDGGALVVTGGTNTFNLTNGTASLDVAAGAAMDINDDVTISKPITIQGSYGTTIASEGQANTITLNESLTIGNGTNVTITSEDNATTVTLDNATFEVENTNATQRLIKITSDKAGDTTLSLKENLSVGDGYDVTLTALGQANTLTLNEGLTVGDGNAGTLTFSAASKTLTISNTADVSGTNTGDVTVSAPISITGQAISLVNDDAGTITEIDTDILADSDTKLPTSKAVKTAVDLKLSIASVHLPFYTAAGALDVIPLTVDMELPFYKADGNASDIPLTT